MYILSLLKHKSRRCSSEFSHFLSTNRRRLLEPANLFQRYQEKYEKWGDITAETMGKKVNSVIHCNTNHHVMTFPFLILLGLLERIHIFLEHSCCAKGEKFQSQSFVMLCRHSKRWLKYILFKFQFDSVICKSHWAGPSCEKRPHLGKMWPHLGNLC